jgi:alkylhydroperoxidase/carboxymuconolactone decarboxylase family protein YurZ
MPSLTPRQQESKDAFVDQRGVWSPLWESIARIDPDFLDAYRELSMVPWRKTHLDAKTKELIYIAIDANATHMYLPGVRSHIQAAFRAGATVQEIMEVIECASTLGIHAMNIGVPILTEVLTEKGMRTGPAELDEHQEKLKEDFTRTRGYWHSFWDEILELDPEMFEAYTEFSSVPWRNGTLGPKVREFIYIAFDVAATHLYKPGLKLHLENAIDYGATVGEILEVMEIASVLGIHAATSAVPLLVVVAEAAGRPLDERPAG